MVRMDIERSASDTPPRHQPIDRADSDFECTGLSACDSCYQRKIKCDRKSPCGNCQDSRTACLRRRQKQKRKPRENVSSKLNETRQQMEARMATLESTITGLMSTKQSSVMTSDATTNGNTGASTGSRDTIVSGANSTASIPRKRTHTEAASVASSHTSPSRKVWSSYANEPSYSTPPFSAIEAQNMIRQELSQGTNLSKQKREAFHAALGSLTDSLNTSYFDAGTLLNEPYKMDAKKDTLDALTLPDIETIKWLLAPRRTYECLWTLPDSIPLISRDTIAQMALDIHDPQKRRSNPAAVVCICSLAAHFLIEHMMSSRENSILDASIRDKIDAYFATARDAQAQIGILAPPSLPHIQALIFGAVNAQESGHPMDAWKLNAAACNICIELNLHKTVNAFSSATLDILTQARCCLLVCYINDKGLAMNLGKPPSLPDSYIEIDLRELVFDSDFACRQSFQDYALELSFIQSSIIELQLNKRRMKNDQLQLEITGILKEMEKAWNIIDSIPQKFPDALPVEEMECEIVMGKFSFYTIKTVLFHSCVDNLNNSIYREPLLQAARCSLEQVQNMRNTQIKFNDYKSHSFAHWTVLYYPFTSFFVLFCNVISKKYLPDYELMLAFVEYLTSVKSTSAPVAKLHNLCLPFCALASTALKSNDDPQKGISSERSTKGHKETGTEKLPHQLQQDLEAGVPQSQKQVTQMEQQMLPEQTFIPPSGDLSNDAAFELNDDVLAQFMDFQPRLQWLNTDFSAFEQTWGNTGFGVGQDGISYPDFSGDGFQ